MSSSYHQMARQTFKTTFVCMRRTRLNIVTATCENKMPRKLLNEILSQPPDCRLDTVIELCTHLPFMPAYSSLLKLKAGSLLNNGSQNQAQKTLVSAYLAESTGQGMRSKAVAINGYVVHNPDLSTEGKERKVTSIRILRHSPQVSHEAKLAELIQKLPTDLIVLQITEVYNHQQNIQLSAGASNGTPTPKLMMTRFAAQAPPITFQVTPCETSLGTGETGLFKLFEKTMKEHQSIHDGSSRLSREKYWKMRKEHDINMKEVVKVLEEKWLGPSKCLLWNKFEADENNALVEELFAFVVKRLGQLKPTPEQQAFLRLLCQAGHSYTQADLRVAVASCLNLSDGDSRVVAIAARMQELKFAHFNSAPRHPIVLVLDKKLQMLPWESLSCLSGQPVSRVPSLHFLCLFLARYQDRLTSAGSVRFYSPLGGYVLNPGADLPKMEARMKPFFEALWGSNGHVGSVTTEQFLGLLKKNELVVYCGHGSGAQFLHGEMLALQDLNVLPLLMGCSSGALEVPGRRTEPMGHVFHYFIAGSPAVLGNLWQVTDLETDSFTVRLLEMWLATKRKEGVNWSKDLPGPPTTTEANMLVAVARARQLSKSALNSMAPVVYGLPVDYIPQAKK